jgi:hypothetical protein
MRTTDRRRRRSLKPVEALRLQLAAARKAAGIDSLVLADEAGLCIAAVGAGWPHEEIAAYAAMVGTKVENFEGNLYSTERCWNVRIRRFRAEGADLLLCAVGGGGEPRAQGLQRSISGVTRILAA